MSSEIPGKPMEDVAHGNDAVGRRGDLEVVAPVPNEIDSGEADHVRRRHGAAVDRDRRAVHALPGRPGLIVRVAESARRLQDLPLPGSWIIELPLERPRQFLSGNRPDDGDVAERQDRRPLRGQ